MIARVASLPIAFTLALVSAVCAGDSLSLEELFPEKGLFGPSARNLAFSADGEYAAYLWRTYPERRHGSDLWIVETGTAEKRRVTKVSVMSEFQADAREVRDHRLGKAKGPERARPEGDAVSGEWEGRLRGSGLAGSGLECTLSVTLYANGSVAGTLRSALFIREFTDGKFDAEAKRVTGDLEGGGRVTIDFEEERARGKVVGDDGEWTLDLERKAEPASVPAPDDALPDDVRIDTVSEKDAEDEKAPRYRGVSSFVWSPTSAELLFISGGDVYRYRAEDDTIERLTRTREAERSVAYLPDGSGYTYLEGSALMRVAFGSSTIEQIDPPLEDGATMESYRVSPDGKQLAFIARKRLSNGTVGRKVTVISYKDRFARAREVNRVVSDDNQRESELRVCLSRIDDGIHERDELVEVYREKHDDPRDFLATPEWAPDSSRVTFASYDQRSATITVYEAIPGESEAGDGASGEVAKVDSGAVPKDDGAKPAKKDKGDEPESKAHQARPVHRSLHSGGPNTPYMVEPQYLFDSRRIVVVTEQSGFRQLDILDPVYESLEPLTRGAFEVYPVGLSRDHRRLFVTTTRDHPARRNVEVISLEDGGITQVAPKAGTYSGVAVSDDGRQLLANFVTYGELRELVHASDGRFVALTDSHPEKAAELTQAKPEFFSYPNRHGHEIHGLIFRPKGLDPADERPLLVYVYGGPLGERKIVTDGSYSSDSYFFARYMCEKHGYVTVAIDPRGASGYGAVFEKANFERVGEPQVEDLVDGVKYLVEQGGIDADRVGIHGWSFGGFQTQMCLYTEPEVFACGIAGAGPTEWENYNSWYSTGTIGKSREGKADLEKFSLLPLAKNLESKLLLVHGVEDTNVLYQDTVRVYRELLKAGKETLVELFIDPTGGHGLGGDVKRLGRYRKYEEFLVRVLGSEAEIEGAAREVEGKTEEF